MRGVNVPGRALRALAATLSVALGGSPLLEAVHAARVQHVACPQDGELIDAVASKPQIEHSDELGSVLPGGSGLPSGHGHDHCALAAQARTRARSAPSSALAGPAPAVTSAALQTAHDAPRPARVSLYLLAPKVSPPAV